MSLSCCAIRCTCSSSRCMRTASCVALWRWHVSALTCGRSKNAGTELLSVMVIGHACKRACASGFPQQCPCRGAGAAGSLHRSARRYTRRPCNANALHASKEQGWNGVMGGLLIMLWHTLTW